LSTAAFARGLRFFDVVFDEFRREFYRGIADRIIELRFGAALPAIALRERRFRSKTMRNRSRVARRKRRRPDAIAILSCHRNQVLLHPILPESIGADVAPMPMPSRFLDVG
jgi:hypothetical protein